VLRVARILAKGGLLSTDEPQPPPRSPRTSVAGTAAAIAAAAAATEPPPASESAVSSSARRGDLKRRGSLGGLGLGRPVALELELELEQAHLGLVRIHDWRLPPRAAPRSALAPFSVAAHGGARPLRSGRLRLAARVTPLVVQLTPPMITAAASALRAQEAVGASLSAAAATTRHMLPTPAPAAATASAVGTTPPPPSPALLAAAQRLDLELLLERACVQVFAASPAAASPVAATFAADSASPPVAVGEGGTIKGGAVAAAAATVAGEASRLMLLQLEAVELKLRVRAATPTERGALGAAAGGAGDSSRRASQPNSLPGAAGAAETAAKAAGPAAAVAAAAADADALLVRVSLRSLDLGAPQQRSLTLRLGPHAPAAEGGCGLVAQVWVRPTTTAPLASPTIDLGELEAVLVPSALQRLSAALRAEWLQVLQDPKAPPIVVPRAARMTVATPRRRSLSRSGDGKSTPRGAAAGGAGGGDGAGGGAAALVTGPLRLRLRSVRVSVCDEMAAALDALPVGGAPVEGAAAAAAQGMEQGAEGIGREREAVGMELLVAELGASVSLAPTPQLLAHVGELSLASRLRRLREGQVDSDEVQPLLELS
jgi:hypothetical protein